MSPEQEIELYRTEIPAICKRGLSATNPDVVAESQAQVKMRMLRWLAFIATASVVAGVSLR